MYQLMFTKKKAPDYSKVHRSLQNCGYPVQYMPSITILAPKIERWLPDFTKICDLLTLM